MDVEDALICAREHAEAVWSMFLSEAHGIPDAGGDDNAWRTSTAPDGSPHLSMQITGDSAPLAVELFTAGFHIPLLSVGDQRPQFDYSVPGRTSCVCRKHGVWIELWHPDTPQQPAGPAPVRPSAVPGARRGLGARLTFTRNRRTTTPKETTTR